MLQPMDLINKGAYQPYAWNVQKGVAVLSHHHLRQAAPILQIGEIFRSNLSSGSGCRNLALRTFVNKPHLFSQLLP